MKKEVSTMINKISLQNFKSFKELNDLELKPLTIVLGKNSCGKSSIMQSLLLLKQTLDSDNRDTVLCVEGEYLKLSNIKEVSHNLPAVNKSKISYGFKLLDDDEVESEISLEFKNKKLNGINCPTISKCKSISNDDGEVDFANLKKSTIKRIKNRYFKNDYVVTRNVGYHHFLPQTLEINMVDSDEKHNPLMFLFFKKSIRDFKALSNFLKGLKYLSPIRANPEKYYIHYSQEDDVIDKDGSNAALVFWANQDKKVTWKGSEVNLKDAVNDCMSLVGLDQKIDPNQLAEVIYKLDMSLNDSNKKVSLSDVGFGYSQVLPVILMGLLSDRDNLVMIEQPEIHLHPSSAANLADLFLGLIEDDRRFLIETHSQDFINKLRLRVIQNPELKDKINIVFVEQDANTAIAKQFSINEEGMFPEWPDGFLDESAMLARELIRARVKRKKERG